MTKQISSVDEVVAEIAAMLMEAPGETLADMHREICGSTIRYTGDSLFEYED